MILRKLFSVAAVVLVILACSRDSEQIDDQAVLELSVFRWDLDLPDSDPIAQFIETEFNLEFESISPSWNAWPEQLMSRIAAGSTPDIFVGYGPMDSVNYRQWIAEELVLPLNEYIEQHQRLSEYMDQYRHQQVDGVWYSVPVEDVSDHVMIIRGDWLDELDMAIPETIDEIREVAQGMRDHYGITPITSSAPHTAGFFWLNSFFYAHGSRWDDWSWKESEGWIPSWIAEESYQSLKFLRELHREGLLDPDFLTNPDSRKWELFTTGEVGIVFHNQVDSYIDGLAHHDDEGRIIIAPPPEGPGGRGMWGLDGYFSSVLIRSDLPEHKVSAFFEFLEHLHTDEGEKLFTIGIEDMHYTKVDDEYQPTNKIARNESETMNLAEVLPHARLRYLRAQEWLWTPPWHPHHGHLQRAAEIGREYGQPPLFENVVTEAAEEYEDQLRDRAYSAYADMVTSQRPLTELWEEFVNLYREYGGDEMISEFNSHPAVPRSK